MRTDEHIGKRASLPRLKVAQEMFQEDETNQRWSLRGR